MNFTAPAFVLLFPIVLALHWMLPPSRRWVLLLAASLGFYAVGSPQASRFTHFRPSAMSLIFTAGGSCRRGIRGITPYSSAFSRSW